MSAHKIYLAPAICIGLLVFADGCHKYSLVQPTVPNILNRGIYTDKEYREDLKKYQEELDGDNNQETLKQLRDRMTFGIMGEIDDAYGQFFRRLYAGKADVALTGDSVVLGLAAAATIATNPATKTILSALGTAITGVNLSIDKNFYAQQTFQTIAVAMQTRRDKARETISQRLVDDDAEDYPWLAVKRDLIAYFYAGTLPGGLQELQEEAGNAAKVQADQKNTGIH